MDGVGITRHLLNTRNQLPIYMKQLCRQWRLLCCSYLEEQRAVILSSQNKVLKNKSLSCRQAFCLIPQNNLVIKEEMQDLTDDWSTGCMENCTESQWEVDCSQGWKLLVEILIPFSWFNMYTKQEYTNEICQGHEIRGQYQCNGKLWVRKIWQGSVVQCRLSTCGDIHLTNFCEGAHLEFFLL